MRFDDLVRSERYFTATLLPLVLFHNKMEGVQRFVKLVASKTSTECSPSGERVSNVDPKYDFQDVEVITEFHIKRDLTFSGKLVGDANGESGDEGERERRDAPDVVIVAGRELVVCEGKFFSEFGAGDLNKQLRSQRLQVRLLFQFRQEQSWPIRAYRHVAILPFVPKLDIDADAVLTWDDIRALGEELMGRDHYVTTRLRNAVEWWNKQHPDPSILNYVEKLSFDDMRNKCRNQGSEISVGHEGGEASLRTRDLPYLQGKKWKWRDKETGGSALKKNWLPGGHWLKIVESRLGDGNMT